MDENVTINKNSTKRNVIVLLVVLIVVVAVSVLVFYVMTDRNSSVSDATTQEQTMTPAPEDESPYTQLEYVQKMEGIYQQVMIDVGVLSPIIAKWPEVDVSEEAALEQSGMNLGSLQMMVDEIVPPNNMGSVHRDFVLSFAYLSNSLKELNIESKDGNVVGDRARNEFRAATETLERGHTALTGDN